jgi:hypothetical protein
LRLPDGTSTGAVPSQAAKWLRSGNRAMSRASPMTVAATTGADAEQAGEAGAGRAGCGTGLLPGLADPGIDAAQVPGEAGGELAAGGGDRVRRSGRR